MVNKQIEDNYEMEQIYREISSKINEFLIGVIDKEEFNKWSDEAKERFSRRFNPEKLENLLLFGTLKEIQIECGGSKSDTEHLEHLKDCLDGEDDYVYRYSLLREKPGYIEITDNKAVKEVYARLKKGQNNLSKKEAEELLCHIDRGDLIGIITDEAIRIMSDNGRKEEKAMLRGLQDYLEGRGGYSVEVLFSRDRQSVIYSISLDDEKIFTARCHLQKSHSN